VQNRKKKKQESIGNESGKQAAGKRKIGHGWRKKRRDTGIDPGSRAAD
jgi:hypothetical protein